MKILLYAFLAVLFVLLSICGPLAFIWAINTLFSLGIEYTLKTWAAAAIIGLFLTTSSIKK